MQGTPTEVVVANALATAMTDERRERSPFARRRPAPTETAQAALLRLRADEEEVAAFIKDVVFADEAAPIPFRDFEDEFDREIVCVDLTDGGSVWIYDLDGDPRWLPREEFDLRAAESEPDDEEEQQAAVDEVQDDDEDIDDNERQRSLDAAWMILFAFIVAAAVVAALWLAFLPSGS